VTSGQDGIYPEGFLIGTVEHAERGAETYRLINVQPAVDFSYIDVVLVILVKQAPPSPTAPEPPPAAPAGRGRGGR